MNETAEAVAGNLTEDRINVVLGRNRPPIISLEVAMGGGVHVEVITGGHPEDVQAQTERLLNQDRPGPTAIITNRYEALKEVELRARTSTGLQIRWIVCDEGVSAHDKDEMPSSSVLDHAVSLFERDLDASFS